jgi:hypothetical protein
VNESAGALEHHYTRHEASRSSRREDERLPWRKARRCDGRPHACMGKDGGAHACMPE